MTSAKKIPFEQIRNWVRAESAKGRPMKEIVTELATRDNVTLLSVHDSPEVMHQKTVDALKKFKRLNDERYHLGLQRGEQQFYLWRLTDKG